jgi:hypothetical protein
MGLGTVSENGGATFLSIAGGYIWDRKADKSNPNFGTQEWEKADKSIGVRQGARYADLSGKIVMAEFKTHPEYGESVNVTIDAGNDRYIISISTGNRYSQDMMKALLKLDLTKDVFLKPYDFTGKDKKRAQGISFRQDGEKVDLRVDDAPTQDAAFFKTAEKKKIKRFFEDLNDWFVEKIEEEVIPNFAALAPKEKKEVIEEDDDSEEIGYDEQDEPDTSQEPAPKKEVAPKKEAPKKEAEPVEEALKVTPLKMKKVLRSFIEENYAGKSLPDLDKDELTVWYNLAIAEEELPFSEDGEVSDNDIEGQLDALLG